MRICSQPPRPPRGPARPILTVAGGTVGAAYGALGGTVLAQTYGPSLLNDAVPHVLNAVSQGTIGADTALRALQWAAQPANQALAGALSLGLVGAISGAALTYALLS
jgi:hypothetical protein